jgi:menaquinone-dependent protoporphyrinogen oxidase
VTGHQTILREIPVAYFYTCLSLVQGTSNPIDDKQVYDDTLLSMNTQVKPIMVAGFPGTLKLEVMPWYFRFPLKWIAKSNGVSEGDYRDWAMIKRWTHHFVHTLAAP